MKTAGVREQGLGSNQKEGGVLNRWRVVSDMVREKCPRRVTVYTPISKSMERTRYTISVQDDQYLWLRAGDGLNCYFGYKFYSF